jgi:hypothetical protein
MKKLPLIAMMAALAVVCVAQGDHVPAYNHHPLNPGDALPILPKDQLWGEAFKFPYQVHAYEIAAKIPGVIYQLPCYCYCERIGHNSLHTCFESAHGAHCAICMKEAYYAYQQTKLKKTPAQIRDGIIKGEWKSIDLDTAATMN